MGICVRFSSHTFNERAWSELESGKADIGDGLEAQGERHPGVRAVAWLVDGTSGVVACVREPMSGELLFGNEAREDCKALAWALASQPALILETILAELAGIKAERMERQLAAPPGER